MSAPDLEQAISAHVERLVHSLPISEGASRIDIQVQAVDSRLRLAECFTPLELDGGRFQGYGRLTVRVSCRSPRPWVLYVPASVAIFREAVVAATPIARGSLIEADAVTLAQTNILDSGGHHIEDPERVLGMQAKRNIGLGKLVTESQLQAPTLIRRGDEVQVLARHGEVAVRVSGTALGDGREGEQIRVRNRQSERVIRARVLGPGEVEAIL